jgi:hypothetical protein
MMLKMKMVEELIDDGKIRERKTGTYPQHPAKLLHLKLAITRILPYSPTKRQPLNDSRILTSTTTRSTSRSIPAAMSSKKTRLRIEEISTATIARSGVLEDGIVR